MNILEVPEMLHQLEHEMIMKAECPSDVDRMRIVLPCSMRPTLCAFNHAYYGAPVLWDTILGRPYQFSGEADSPYVEMVEDEP